VSSWSPLNCRPSPICFEFVSVNCFQQYVQSWATHVPSGSGSVVPFTTGFRHRRRTLAMYRHLFCFLSVGLYTAVQCQSHAPNAVRAWPGSIPAFSPSFVHPSFTLLYSISQFPFGRWGSFLAKNTLELSSRLPTSCFPLPRSPTISTPEAFLPSYGPTRTSPAYIRIGRFLLR
jgi:hypothetical protein